MLNISQEDPRFPLLDSISPEVNETSACEAISGTNNPLTDTLKINDKASAAAPAASPQIKKIIR